MTLPASTEDSMEVMEKKVLVSKDDAFPLEKNRLKCHLLRTQHLTMMNQNNA